MKTSFQIAKKSLMAKREGVVCFEQQFYPSLTGMGSDYY
jgi:hypothetical protein